jgi:hypothetical protein
MCGLYMRLKSGVNSCFGWMESYLKKYPVRITTFISIISLLSLFFLSWQIALGLIGGSFASIFVALKYRLDQANYHKDLFDSRYECFLVVEKILDEWVRNLTTNKEMKENLDSIIRKSYFLFSNSTFQFIMKFREILIREMHRNKRGETESITEDSRFLEKLTMDNNLLVHFAELKIDSY